MSHVAVFIFIFKFNFTGTFQAFWIHSWVRSNQDEERFSLLLVAGCQSCMSNLLLQTTVAVLHIAAKANHPPAIKLSVNRWCYSSRDGPQMGTGAWPTVRSWPLLANWSQSLQDHLHSRWPLCELMHYIPGSDTKEVNIHLFTVGVLE